MLPSAIQGRYRAPWVTPYSDIGASPATIPEAGTSALKQRLQSREHRKPQRGLQSQETASHSRPTPTFSAEPQLSPGTLSTRIRAWAHLHLCYITKGWGGSHHLCITTTTRSCTLPSATVDIYHKQWHTSVVRNNLVQ